MRRTSFLLIGLLCLLALPLQAQEPEDELESPLVNRDPFESYNRAIFEFNDRLDTYLMKPVAQGYHFIMPDFAEQGVTNFFANLYDANSALNSLLQGRGGDAARSTGRFLVNSTFGVLGFFDVAQRMDLTPTPTDFGHTLATWGVPRGPYIVVPLLGSRTVRSGVGNIVDAYGTPQNHIHDVRWRNSLYGLELIDARTRLLQAEELLSGDRYIFIRDAYLQQREALVNDGMVEDSFSDFGEDGDWEEEF